MKLLERKDINRVKPKFRTTVLDAWGRGENVPYSVVYLSDAPLTKKEAHHAKEIINKHKWDK